MTRPGPAWARWLWDRTAGRSVTLWLCWRPYCWVRGYHTPTKHPDAWWEACTVCDATLWTQFMTDARPRWIDRPRLATSWRWFTAEGRR